MEKILVTGVGGNVGQYIANELSHAGHEVIGIYHNAIPKNAEFELVKADLALDLLDLHSIDTVIHIAAGLDGTTKRMIKDNLKATENVINFAERADVRRIIYMSTVSVYGTAKGELCEDSDVVNPNGYGMTKLLCECLVRESKIPEKLIIQLPRMLGPFVDLSNTQNSGFLTMTRKILQGDDVICFIPEVKYNNYLHVDSLLKFLERIFSDDRHFENEKILLGARERLKMLEILQIMKNEIGSRTTIVAQDTGAVPHCSLINITKAEKLGFSPCKAEDMLKRFIREVYMREDNKM